MIGYVALVWDVTLLPVRDSRDWQGSYPQLVEQRSLDLASDVCRYSLNRCQVFTRRGSTRVSARVAGAPADR